MTDVDTVFNFMKLFRGFPNAYGTGVGGWVHRPAEFADYMEHLDGHGNGIGIGPLLADGTCWFAAIDLDRPDFVLAQEMMSLLPGVSWLERSRSGNAHVHTFFSSTIDAWVPRGILREACAALGERGVEVFPKTDRLLPGMVGNYLNLPYFGDTRPIIAWQDDEGYKERELTAEQFAALALNNRNDPADWIKRARWMGIPSPAQRDTAKSQQFGEQPYLHMCAEHVLANRDKNPVVAGHRAVVYFTLAKQFSNWREIDHDEALTLMTEVNDASPDPIPTAELERILKNAERGEFTSTGCDDPLFAPYAHPDCPIANPKGT